ncbi:MAG: hypothetical protein NTV18_01310 [Actinobacteria bacterium]|nr:hypothetical protein [Actinomycetota bacterium]
MKSTLKLISLLIVSLLTVGMPSLQAANQYEAKWRVSNSDIPEPYFTLWPSRIPSGQAFRGVFPACTPTDATDCIKSVAYQDAQSRWIEGKVVSYFPVDEDYETLPGKVNYKFTDSVYSLNPAKDSILPKSARSSIWTFPGIEHSGGTKFLLTFTIFRGGNDRELLYSTAPTEIAIVPMSDSTQDITKAELDGVIPYLALLSEPNSKTRCYFDSVALKKYCTQREDFTNFKPIKIVVNLKAHLDIFRIIDWFTARNLNTEIFMKKLGDGSADLTFQGTPILINSAESYRPATLENFVLGRKIWNSAFAASQSPGLKPIELDLSRTQCFNPIPQNANPNPNCNGFADMTLHNGFSSEDNQSYVIWRELEKYFPILPKSPVSVWNFKTMNPLGQDFFDLTKCSSRIEPSGVLSSNATLLVPSPPKWNKENESLDYNLASTHLDTTGKVVSGFYELRVSTTVAKCLWGNDLSQAKAQIQIFSATENTSQSVEVSTLEIKDGYVLFKASGFHYSANEIKLKIIGAKNSKAPESTTPINPESPTATPIATAPALKPTVKRTITCVKGKVTKKVTAVNPKCPAGFKKK